MDDCVCVRAILLCVRMKKNGENAYRWNLLPIASSTQPTVPSPPQHITLKFSTSLNIVKPTVEQNEREKEKRTKIKFTVKIYLFKINNLFLWLFFFLDLLVFRWQAQNPVYSPSSGPPFDKSYT